MNNNTKFLLPALLCLLLIPITYSATVTLDYNDIINDTYVLSSYPDTNYYLNSNLEVGNNLNTPISASYITFDLSDVPSTTINSAQFCVYGHSSGGGDCFDKTLQSGVFRVKVDDFDYSNVTWNNQPCGSGFSNTTACETSPEGTITKEYVDTAVGDDYIGTYICYDITNMLSTEKSNDNILTILLKGINSDGNCNVLFYSKEGSTNRPYITVDYQPTTTTTVPAPSNVSAEIVDYYFSDTEPVLNQEVTIRIKIRNTGNVSYNFVVGLSIGNLTSGVFCNRDCYTDGKGDYVYTGTIAPDETVEVERTFKFLDTYFDEHGYYDTIIAVYYTTYLPPSQAYDNVTLDDNFYIKRYDEKIFAYAYSIHPSKTITSQGDIIDVTAYVINNQTLTWNYTLGMSLGIWDAVDGQVYTSHRPSLIPPCNLECYTDDKGDWVALYIPPNFTAPFNRQFKIPEYFLTENYFDVAVSVWTNPPDEGGRLISIVYFKNISYVSSTPSTAVTTGQSVKSLLDMLLTTTSISFGTDTSGSKLILWGVFNLIVIVSLIYTSAKAGINLNVVPIILGVLLITSFVGIVIGWVPVVVGIIAILISGLLLFKILIG